MLLLEIALRSKHASLSLLNALQAIPRTPKIGVRLHAETGATGHMAAN